MILVLPFWDLDYFVPLDGVVCAADPDRLEVTYDLLLIFFTLYLFLGIKVYFHEIQFFHQ